MDCGEGSSWFENLMDEVGLAVLKADDALQKNLKTFGSDAKELWSNLIKEMSKLVNLGISKTSDSMFQAKNDNLGNKASKFFVDDSTMLDEANIAARYINAWFLNHSEEDCENFVTAVASQLRSKGHPDLAADVEELLVGPLRVTKLTEAFASFGKIFSDSVEDIDVTGRERVLHRNGNRYAESIGKMDTMPVEEKVDVLSDLDALLLELPVFEHMRCEEEIMKIWNEPIVPLLVDEVDEDLRLFLESGEKQNVYEMLEKGDFEGIEKLVSRLCGFEDNELLSNEEKGMLEFEEGKPSKESMGMLKVDDEDVLYSLGEEEEVAKQIMEPLKKRDEGHGNASSSSSSKDQIACKMLAQDDKESSEEDKYGVCLREKNESSDEDMGGGFVFESQEEEDASEGEELREKDESSDEDMGGGFILESQEGEAASEEEEEEEEEEGTEGSNAAWEEEVSESEDDMGGFILESQEEEVASEEKGEEVASEEEGKREGTEGSNAVPEEEASESEWVLL